MLSEAAVTNRRTVTPIRLAIADTDTFGPLSTYLGPYELHLRARGQAAKTIEKKLLAVRQLAAFLDDPDLGAITRADIQRFVADRLAHGARSSAATTVNALRTFFGPVRVVRGDEKSYLDIELGHFDSPMVGVTAPNFEAPVVEVAPDEVLSALIAGAEKAKVKTYEDVRDAALLRCFIDSGARLSEITGLGLADLLPLDDGRMLLRVLGKGRGGGPRERHVPIGEKAGLALRRYLRLRAQHPYSKGTDRLWIGLRGPLTISGVRRMVYKRSAAAGMRLHPHQLRHTWAVAMKADDRNRDADIMHLAGWTNPKMLARYGRVVTGEQAVKAFYAHGAPGDSL